MSDMSNIKLIVSEVDGVLTEGKVFYDELSNVPYKLFNMDDLEVINKLKCKFPIVFLSSDNKISYNFFRNKNIPFYWAKKSKKDVFLQILRRYNVTAEEVLFVASKLSDLECACLATNTVCPNNANLLIRRKAKQLKALKGDGVLTEIYIRYFM